MRYIYKGWHRYLLSLLLCTALMMQPIIPVHANDRSAAIIGSSPLLVKGLLTPSGLSGKGQIVGIADSGLDKGSISDIHPDLQSESGYMPKIVMLKSYTDRETADDPSGHGTFMAATIAGTGNASQGKYQGIAPGASLYFQALLDKNNNLQIPANINELFLPAYSAGVRIHVDGWGGGSNTYDASSAAVDKFIYWYPDFLPIFGAGNSGYSKGTLTSEANSKNALVVGSSQVPRPAFDPEARYADQVSASSSRGPAGDGRIKPDLLVPGSALISARSSLIEGNYAANSMYTRMGGTSMAAAVAGGALALLREQLASQFDLKNPSSALLKALLINGARSGSGNIAEQGFGILDLAGTALALKEGNFQFIEEKNRIQDNQTREYKFKVTDPGMPVKVTLVWTDPPGSPGDDIDLVDNLDLIVQDSNGKNYYGNDFNGQGQADKLNNVEQVSIQVPKAGEYTVKVKAAGIKDTNGQDFALVYGQTLRIGVVTSFNNNQISLNDGSSINLNKVDLHQEVDGLLNNSVAKVQVGSQVYLSSTDAYVFGQTWETGGIQALPTAEGDMLLEMNTTVREGGYYLDPRASAAGGSITVNGQPVSSILNIPAGSELKAAVNPALQTLWKLEAANQEISGFISTVNPDTREIKLLKDPATYRLAAWAAISCRDNILDSSAQDAPYGSADSNSLETLMPGSKITMQVSPGTGVVQSLLVERPVVIGKVSAVKIAEDKIILDTGKSYNLLVGTSIYHNKLQANLEDIQQGDLIMAVLLPDGQTIIELQAFSQVTYGRVAYVSNKRKILCLIDDKNRSQIFTLDTETAVYRSGIPLDFSAIASGNWVRVLSDASGTSAWRIDLAEIAQESTKTVASVNTVNNTFSMTDGTEYNYSGTTRISKDGYNINPEDIMPGEEAEITVLSPPSPWAPVLASVEVNAADNIPTPYLSITARSLNGALVIQGYTTADRLYLYRQDGSRERIIVNDGNISGLYRILDGEKELRVVALDTGSTGINAMDIEIAGYPISSVTTSFSDTLGHWAEKHIASLVERNIVKGYEDGSYRPDQPVSRAEMAVMIARMQNFGIAAVTGQPVFRDYKDIPWWALGAVLADYEAGLLKGYSDGSFQPDRSLTRIELETIVARIKGLRSVNLFPGEASQQDRPVTRGETAAIIDQIEE